MPIPYSGQRKPQQDRSRITRDKLLRATERLLQHRPFEVITISDIVRKAGLSVGAFYSRFTDKAAILGALYERYDKRLAEDHRNTVPATGTLEQVCAGACRSVVRYYRERRWFMRAMCLYARSSPKAVGREMRDRRASLHRILAERLAGSISELRHENPIRAAEWGLFVVAAVARDKILFSDAPHSQSIAASDAELERILTRTLISYFRYDMSASAPLEQID